ncbi:MAG TPA: extracellular solute-binding protein [Chloroflexota bacterium]|nr:extracellular solute-binding protein [Chloroflexota bacterium]
MLTLTLTGCGGSNTASSQSAQPSASPVGASASAQASPAGSGSAAASSAASPGNFDDLLAAAKKEGKVELLTAPGDLYRKFYDAFSAKYGIQLDINVGNGQADQVPRVESERQAGQYLWDVVVHSPQGLFNGYKRLGALEPLRPVLLPEIVDDSKWAGGFNAGWADSDKTTVYTFVQYSEWAAWVNRDIIPEAQLNKYDQLWDPKWKGKIAWQDPRIPSSAVAKAAAILKYKGEDKLRSMFRDQALTITQDRRQLAEWVLRGQYPIAIGIEQVQFGTFEQQGIKVNVPPLRDPDPVSATRASGTGSVGYFNRAPHPNAARFFINWLLSQEGQSTYANLTKFNVRRSDVPIVDPDTAVDPKREYLDVGTQESYPFYTQTLNIAKEMLK